MIEIIKEKLHKTDKLYLVGALAFGLAASGAILYLKARKPSLS